MTGRKIIFSSNTSWTIYNFRRGVIRFLLSQGCEIVVIALEDNTTGKLTKMGCTFIPLPINARGINPVSDLLIIKKYYDIYKKLKPDFVFHFTIKPAIYGALAARLAKVKSISVITGLGYVFIKNNWLTKIVRMLYKKALRYPVETWFLNREDLHVFLKYGLVSSDKSFLLPGEGIDTDFYCPRAQQRQQKTIFLMIARLIWDKGVKEFVEAAEIILTKTQEVEFQLIGELAPALKNGVPERILRDWISRGVVSYLGTTADIRDFIARADCIVLPSYREGIPRSLLEASSMAVPVIASDAPGCRDVVQNEITGFLCQSENAQDLANAFEKFLAMNELERQAMGQAGRAHVIKQYDERKIIGIYIEKLAHYGLFL